MKLKARGGLLAVLIFLGLLITIFDNIIKAHIIRDDASSKIDVILDDQANTLEQPKKPMVIILTYQRCGSSFLGNLFGKNPDAFYVYEPLDSLYTAMYGTAEGWNVPSDITNLHDGTMRKLPSREIQAVSDFQENLLTCNFEDMPIEFLSHKYWRIFNGFQAGLRTYRDCLKTKRLSNTCLKHLKGECPFRFGDDPEKEAKCVVGLWLNNANISSNARISKYRTCSRDILNKTLNHCVPHLKKFCNEASLTAIKTVRGTMESVVPLLEKYPQLRIISLVRDPRSVGLSRMKLHSSRGLYSGDNFTLEAQLYCQTVLQDYDVIEEIPTHSSQRIFPVIYDDFVLHPLNYTERIYKFIGSDLLNVTSSFMGDNTRVNRKSWQQKMAPSDISGINRVCSEFFRRIPWNWQHLDIK